MTTDYKQQTATQENLPIYRNSFYKGVVSLMKKLFML